MSKASDNEKTLQEQKDQRDLAMQLQLQLLTMQQIAPYINGTNLSLKSIFQATFR